MDRPGPIDRLAPHLRGLEAYTPGEQPQGEGWIKLNTNELPYGVPEPVLEAIERESRLLRLYPEPTSRRLRERLACLHGVEPESVLIGNGSDEILNLLARAFGSEGRRVLQTVPSYSLYPVVTAIAGGHLVSVSFEADFKLPLEVLLKESADLIFLTCPNAPTGVVFPMEEIIQLLEGSKGLVVIDEAYVEFSGQSVLPLLRKHPNLVVTRTFSKAYGLAGLRVGYAFGDPGIIELLDRMRDSYNVNRLSQAGALAALDCTEYYEACVQRVCSGRERLIERLSALGWHVYPSRSNFVYGAPLGHSGIPTLESAQSLFTHLKANRILVRHFTKPLLTEGYLRITVGQESEVEQLIKTIEAWNPQE